MTRQQARFAALVASALVGALFLIVGCNTLRWIGTTFPGFFLLANRVVPSIALPDWEAGNPSSLFQSEVVAINGKPVDITAQVYDRVRQEPPGTHITYTLRKPAGDLFTATVASRRFSGGDYALTIGGLTLTGLIFAAIGLAAFMLKPGEPAALALFACCLSSAVFTITAGDLYGPHWFFRLHVLGETFMSPTFMHLALVFPTNRLRRRRRAVLLGLYLPFVALGGFYEWALSVPSAYTTAHLVATAVHGIAAAVLVLSLATGFVRTSAALVRRRVAIVALGTFAGVVLPGALMAASAVLGGRVPVNAGVMTAFLFPLSISYAILKHDLFEIDTMLRRTIAYTAVVLVITAGYLGGLVVIGSMVPTHDLLSQSPATHAMLNLGLLLLVAPAREKVQHQVDRIFFRTKYDAEEVLAELSQRLATARAVDDTIGHALETTTQALGIQHAVIFQRQTAGHFRYVGGAQGAEDEIVLPPDLAARVERGEILTRYEWDDGSGRAMPSLWQRHDAEIVVPMCTAKAVVAIMMLGRKGSGHAYTIHDVAFLRTLANQVVLAMSSATAFAQLEELNSSLEQQVRERTAALQDANTELNDSLEKLRHAYELLGRNQASLLRADRLATLGRLAAGLAHEINTPLGAVLNSLKIITDLAREYADSIGDASVLPEDHAQIAAEILATAEAATTWARKATAFLARTKLHGRELQPGVCRPFALSAVVEETCGLLGHRLRAASCSVRYAEQPEGIVLEGDPSRLGQVLVNLVANSIDAYEENGTEDRHIEISARREHGTAILTVQDVAGGISPAALPHIFDELFTTKGAGTGTGLGLWIARNLIEQNFQGTLTVDSQAGVGSCFTLTLPPTRGGDALEANQISAAMN